MKLRSLVVRVLFVGLFAGFTATKGLGQNRASEAILAPEIETTIANQPGCPLLLAVLSVETAVVPYPADARNDSRRTIRVKVDNMSDKSVRGYTVIFRDEKNSLISSTVLDRFLERGRPLPINASATGEWSRPVISVDYVEFTDGSSWGNDTFKRSQLIERFRSGRDLAMNSLNYILLDYLNPDYFQKQVAPFLGVSIANPTSIPTSEMLKMQFNIGYDSVIKGVTAPGKRLAEGLEIAKRLDSLRPLTP